MYEKTLRICSLEVMVPHTPYIEFKALADEYSKHRFEAISREAKTYKLHVGGISLQKIQGVDIVRDHYCIKISSAGDYQNLIKFLKDSGFNNEAKAIDALCKEHRDSWNGKSYTTPTQTKSFGSL